MAYFSHMSVKKYHCERKRGKIMFDYGLSTFQMQFFFLKHTLALEHSIRNNMERLYNEITRRISNYWAAIFLQ